MKILKREITGNGYGCSCCGHSDEYTEWIEIDKMLNGQKFLEYMENEHKNICEDHCIALQYEKDGKILYGFDSEIYRIGEDKTLILGNKKIKFSSDVDNIKGSKEHKEKFIKYADNIKNGLR